MMFACKWCKYHDIRNLNNSKEVDYCTFHHETVEPNESCRDYKD